MSGKFRYSLLGALALLGLSSAASGTDKSPVVVELFTSQGCSSCPPANANLIKLSQRSDVLALSFSVTYWDYLGWKDSFGKPEFTARQRAYEPALGQGGPFTPQMVIDGSASVVGNDLSELDRAIQRATPLVGPEIQLRSDGTVHIGAGTSPSQAADVWLVRYDPKVVKVPIGRGENTGRTLPHTHVAHSLERIGVWNGDEQSFEISDSSAGWRTAVLVQRARGGSILSAATN